MREGTYLEEAVRSVVCNFLGTSEEIEYNVEKMRAAERTYDVLARHE